MWTEKQYSLSQIEKCVGLELEETLAVVRVLEEGWGGSIDFTDVLLLLKIDGEWKCVAKAYNQNSNTITK